MRGTSVSVLVIAVVIIGPWSHLRASPSPEESSSPVPASQSKTPAKSDAGRQGHDMSWWTVDSGGGESAGGSFSLYAAIAQPETGLQYGCEFVLSGGLLSGAENSGHIFCNGFENGNLSNWSSFVGGH